MAFHGVSLRISGTARYSHSFLSTIFNHLTELGKDLFTQQIMDIHISFGRPQRIQASWTQTRDFQRMG